MTPSSTQESYDRLGEVAEVEHSIEWRICALYNQSNNQSVQYPHEVTVAGSATSNSDGNEQVYSTGVLRQAGGRDGS
jgi:hypothetical protein